MDSARIEDLKRRIEKDPASIAFAQLGEEYRRAGRSREAIETCRAGLNRHPGYLSARVTLGRALLDIGQLNQAESELKEVLRVAPENLAALRALAETLTRGGNHAAALAHYRTALALAPKDVELQKVVESLTGQIGPAAPPAAQVRPAPAPVPRPAAAVPATPATASTPSSAREGPGVKSAPAPPPDPQAARALPALERWLDAIVDDRERRSADH